MKSLTSNHKNELFNVKYLVLVSEYRTTLAKKAQLGHVNEVHFQPVLLGKPALSEWL